MAKTRAIMTETERERIAGRDDVEDIKRYQAITRVRGRIKDELVQDVEVLEEHHPGLLEELREVVCAHTEGDESAAEEPPPEPDDDRSERLTHGTNLGDSNDPPGDHSEVSLSEVDYQSGNALDNRVRAFLNGRNPQTPHGKEALVEAFRLLRQNGVMKTGELKSELSDSYEEHYSSTRAMWESISRYLEDIPGLQKGGYGEWEYAGDDVAREEFASAE